MKKKKKTRKANIFPKFQFQYFPCTTKSVEFHRENKNRAPRANRSHYSLVGEKTTLLGILIKTIPELIRQAQTAWSKETREIRRMVSSIIRVRRIKPRF